MSRFTFIKSLISAMIIGITVKKKDYTIQKRRGIYWIRIPHSEGDFTGPLCCYVPIETRQQNDCFAEMCAMRKYQEFKSKTST